MAHGAFKKPRRLINLEFELQILMTAEFIAEAYYAILRYPTLSYVISQRILSLHQPMSASCVMW